jgi:hypothetical protein
MDSCLRRNDSVVNNASGNMVQGVIGSVLRERVSNTELDDEEKNTRAYCSF